MGSLKHPDRHSVFPVPPGDASTKLPSNLSLSAARFLHPAGPFLTGAARDRNRRAVGANSQRRLYSFRAAKYWSIDSRRPCPEPLSPSVIAAICCCPPASPQCVCTQRSCAWWSHRARMHIDRGYHQVRDEAHTGMPAATSNSVITQIALNGPWFTVNTAPASSCAGCGQRTAGSSACLPRHARLPGQTVARCRQESEP